MTHTLHTLSPPSNLDRPGRFFADSARHFRDEIRLSQAKQQRLQPMGLDIYQVEAANSFSCKIEKEVPIRAAGDTVSGDRIAYDMSEVRTQGINA